MTTYIEIAVHKDFTIDENEHEFTFRIPVGLHEGSLQEAISNGDGQYYFHDKATSDFWNMVDAKGIYVVDAGLEFPLY